MLSSFKYLLIFSLFMILTSCQDFLPKSNSETVNFDQSNEFNSIRGCELSAPQVSLTPNRFSIFAGDTLTFDLKVKNNHKNCSSSISNFSIISKADPGLDMSSVPKKLEIKTDEEVSIPITIPVSKSLTSTNLIFSLNVFDEDNPEYSVNASAPVSVTIVPQCIRTAASVYYSNVNIQGESGQDFSVNLIIKNNDQNCALNEYEISHSGVPEGVELSNITKINLDSGQTQSIPINIKTSAQTTSLSARITTSVQSGSDDIKAYLGLSLTQKEELFKITSVSVTGVSNNSAQVSWASNQVTNGVVHYGKNQILGSTNSSGNNLNHIHDLKNLEADTIYYYQVRARDTQNKEVISQTLNFKTNKDPILTVNPIVTASYYQQIYTLALTQNGDNPEGGYQVLIDNQLRTDLSITNSQVLISGLDNSTRHCFKLRAIYSQLTPARSLDSLESCVEAQLKPATAVIGSVILQDDNQYKIDFNIPSGSLAPEGGYDTYINNVDQNDNARHQGFSRLISGLDTTKRQCFKLESRYTQLEPRVFSLSEEVCVEAQLKPQAVVISTVTRQKDNQYKIDFNLSSSSLIPEGGYDTYINNNDKGDSSKHTGFSRLIEDLDTTKKQCFKLEARYTQLKPEQFLLSNEVCVEGVENDESGEEIILPTKITFHTDFETDQWGANGVHPPAGNFWEVDQGLPRTTDHPSSQLKTGRNGSGRAIWLGSYNNDLTRNELGRDNAMSFGEHWMGVSVYVQNKLDLSRIMIQNRLLANGTSRTVNAISLRQGEPGKLYFSIPTDVNSVDTLPKNGAGSNTESVYFDYQDKTWLDVVIHYKGAFGKNYNGPDTSGYVERIGFDPRSDGFIEIWVNGKKIVDHVGTTAFRYATGGEEVTGIMTPKIGPYWSSAFSPRGDIYYDNYRIWTGTGGSYQVVDPSK